MMERIGIVGAGLAGTVAAETLRREGFSGEILLFGQEDRPAYDRPSLSKSVLLGEQHEAPPIFAEDWASQHDVRLELTARVDEIDLRSRSLIVNGGRVGDLSGLLLATGASAIALDLPGSSLDGVYTLRTNADSLALRAALHPGMRIAIIGAGLIGCEVATSASKLGAHVTLFEAADELLTRVLGHEAGRRLRRDLHAMGVEMRLNARISGFRGASSVKEIETADGELTQVDLALICVGARPEADLANKAGIPVNRGITVDAAGQSQIENVFAAGDVASWPLRAGGSRSLETYLNAQVQGETAARAMLGRGQHVAQIPRSWTEIAGHRIQMIGDINGPGYRVARGYPGQDPMGYFRVNNGAVEGAVVFDSPKDFAVMTRVVEQAINIDEQRSLANPDENIRDLLSGKRR